MRERIVITAVTKMLSGMCTAGITHSEDKWIRPVKEFGTLLIGDLMYEDKSVIQPFDVVELTLKRHRPKEPHVEDWICDFVRERPERVGHLNEDELYIFLDRHCEPNVPQEFIDGERSLGMIRPRSIQAIFRQDNYSDKYEARLQVPEMGPKFLPITDIKWRALGRELLGSKDNISMNLDELKEALVVDDIFIALGLGRMHEGRHWPLVIGVHTFPDYHAQIDYRKL